MAYLGYETVEEEGYLQPKKFKISYRCERCNHEYSRTFKAIPKNDPPCPNKSCSDKAELASLRKQIENLTRMVSEGMAPAQTGKNVRVKAVDQTAQIVMEDYQMTDLKDNIRHGEGVAPKLPGDQQRVADNMFNGGAMQAAGMSKRQVENLGRRAIAGAYRNMAVAPNAMLPTEVRNGQAPLRQIGTEIINERKR